MTIRRVSVLPVLLLAAACGDNADKQGPQAEGTVRTVEAGTPRGVEIYYDRAERRPSPEELERMRLDGSWRDVVELDTTGAGVPVNNPEKWEQITAENVNGGTMFLPLAGDPAGPSVLRTQILLDRAFFSPGIMDGRWGKNTETALYWFQKREGLRATARVDSATFARLTQVAGAPRELVVRRTLTADDVKGPFTQIPEDIYEHAKLECSCYESLSEKLSERYHATPDLLAKLNPGVDLDNLAEGQQLNVPAVRPDDARGGQVARLVVSGRGTYVHALDASGRVLYHFPSTLGGKYSPSPSGDFKVNGVSQDPSWHYQPGILVGVPDNEPEAMIPAGPNVAVGSVWIDLSEPHFGIHGTAEPQTIGYASSNGCVRLTNWDVEFLSRHVRAGVPVEFRDITGQKQAVDPANAEAGAGSATPSDRPAAGGTGGGSSSDRPAASGAASGTGRDSAKSSRPGQGGGRSGRAGADSAKSRS